MITSLLKFGKPFTKNLSVQIGAIVILVELVVLVITGVLYVNRFNGEIDRRLEQQVRLPGILMTRGLLRYQSISDKDTMEELVGEHVLDGMVISVTGEVFQSLNADHMERHVDSLSSFAYRDYLTPELDSSVTLNGDDADSLVNITPIYRDDGVLIGYLYIRVGIAQASQQRADIVTVFILGSLLIVTVTSFIIFFSFRSIVLAPVFGVLRVLEQIKAGDLSARITGRNWPNEIGALQRGVNAMAEERERAESQLKNLNEELEQRVMRRTRDLEIARKEAEQANQVKTQFLANMSHELRTPLNAVLNFTSFVAKGVYGPVNDEQVEVLGQATKSGRHLLSLINDVLDVVKIETGMMELYIQEVSLNDELRSVVSITEGLIKDKPITLAIHIADALPHTYGDRRRLRQVFLNLASNAVKFTTEGSIGIHAGCHQHELCVEIRDTGIGIPEEDQRIIFESFKQLAHDLDTFGTGLGLSIAKFFVEQHGGTISLESEPGRGSTFRVVLPILTRDEALLLSQSVVVE